MQPWRPDDWLVMEGATKRCPQCAEVIEAEARLCEYCGARFEVMRRGYCPQDHSQVAVDDQERCAQCGSEVVDRHLASRFLPEPATARQPPGDGSPDPAGAQPSKADSSVPGAGSRAASRRARPPAGRRLGGCLRWAALLVVVFAAALIAVQLSLRSSSDTVQIPATPTRQVTATQRPTATERPTRTATPPPVEITFDDLGTYPTGAEVILTGRLALFSSTHCGITCGLLLEDIADPSRKVAIFVYVVAPGNTARPNYMESLPEQYVKSDIRVRTDDGTYAGVGFRVRITGQICETTAGEVCIDDIRKIELVTVD